MLKQPQILFKKCTTKNNTITLDTNIGGDVYVLQIKKPKKRLETDPSFRKKEKAVDTMRKEIGAKKLQEGFRTKKSSYTQFISE